MNAWKVLVSINEFCCVVANQKPTNSNEKRPEAYAPGLFISNG
jgi:hypothetical protein